MVTPEVAVAAVVILKGKVLLVKRKNPPSANEWALPGGRIRAGESIKETAEREVFEETGVIIEAGDIVHVFDLIRYSKNDQLQAHYVIIDVQGTYINGQVNAGDDASEAAWIHPDDFKTITLNTNTKKFLNHYLNNQFYSLSLGERT
ncbi:MAG: NUDIX domain-containing protein [Caldithrix sp.]|nr:NUDIX domain-containing protein [Caldithrix sp.]